MVSRREFFMQAGVAALGAGIVSRVAAASLPEIAAGSGPATVPPPLPPSGRPAVGSGRHAQRLVAAVADEGWR